VRTTMKKSPENLSPNQVLEANRNVLRMATQNSAWRTPVAAAVLALALGFAAQDAKALALGRVNVLSALGEPLRAEVDVPDINADEAASLRTSVAGPDAFKAAGLEYNPALSNVQISLQRRANGSSYLRLTSDRPVNEPFVDLILEANWASGRIVRDYTMLFDPPNLRAQAAAPSTITSPASGYTPPAVAPTAPRAAPAPAPYIAAAPTQSRAPLPSRPPAARRAQAPKAQVQAASPKQPDSVTVKAGNTASQLAARYKPQGVSLDQMLVAMLSRNPDAFDAGNVNRLKKGAVLEMPSAATASGTSQAEARQTITAQSKDFNEFRRNLAQGAPRATTPAASRIATGTVQANVEERKPTAAAPDKLTLSKGTVAATGAASAAKASKEEAIAKDKQAKDTAARTAELSKNIQDLAKLGATSTTATTKPSTSASIATATSATGVAVPTVASAPAAPAAPLVASVDKATVTSAAPTAPIAVASAPAVPVPTVTAAAAATPTIVTSTETVAVAAPVTDSKPVAKATPAAPVAEPSFVDSLMDNPVTLPAAGGLLALLAGFGFYRMRQRKAASQVDSSFLESRLQPDSFFGASGGQRIDTSESANAGGAGSSSMVYSPSQLDAAGDVDPVAEADVYLAYGRDLQAEEILKEALRTNPTRVAVHAKLMEIYAKRRDTKAFETVAKEAYNVTRGEGTEWETACTLGREIDPSNPLYQGVAAQSSASYAPMAGAAMATAGVGASAFAGSAMSQPAMASNGQDANVDFDLDLDFSTADDFADAPALANASHAATSPIHVQSTVGMQARAAVDQPVDLAFDMPTLPQFSLPDNKAVKLSAPDMASFANGLNFSAAPPAAGIAPTTPMAFNTAPAAPQLDAMDFDMGDLSLDLPASRTPASAASMAIDAGITGDPLETKLALALEFREIGDEDGARSLAQEVAAEAKGDLKARAQRMVADLS
jgi:pilus assembly protein FimV